ncbi:Phosphate-regulating neutral endopeptidase [Aphelenchoides bicaudatus]|nr:Phosphate-regulating neutral endopeptidase [Aphelenchoides bicaudatus]
MRRWSGDPFLKICLIIFVLLAIFVSVCAQPRKQHNYQKKRPGTWGAGNQRTDTSFELNQTPNPLWSESFDQKAEPCDNFYKFVCGKHNGEFDELTKNKKCMQDALRNTSDSSSSAVQKMRQYEESFKNNRKTVITIEEVLKEIRSFGACPVVDQEWNPREYDLVHALHVITNLTSQMYLYKMERQSLTDGSVDLKIAASNPFALFSELDAFHDGDSRKIEETIVNLLSATIDEADVGVRKSYLRHLAHQFIVTKTRVQQMIQDANGKDYNEAFENTSDEWFIKPKPANLTADEQQEDVMRFDKLQELLPLVGSRYFLDSPFVSEKLKNHLRSNPEILLDKKKLLISLDNFYSQMHIGVLADHLCIEYLLEQSTHLNLTGHDYIGSAEDAFVEPDRIDTLLLVQTKFPLIADYLFVSKCTSPATIQTIKAMVEPIRSSARTMFEESEWLDNESKLHVINKLEMMKINVGAFEVSKDVRRLDYFYRNLKFEEGDSMRDLERKLNLFQIQQELQLIVWPDETRWLQHIRASEQNAYNLQRYNRIAILGGYIDPTTFDPNMPEPVNFGAMGATIAHEMFHSFDINGIRYDVAGADLDLLSPDVETEYKRRSQCIIDQYGAIRDQGTGRRLKAKETINEDLCDQAGLRAALLAHKSVEGLKRQKRVPGFTKYEGDQLFFIGFAESECYGNSQEIAQYMLESDIHTPSEHRINEVLKNFPEFGEAFKCPAGSPMNPEKKCQIW